MDAILDAIVGVVVCCMFLGLVAPWLFEAAAVLRGLYDVLTGKE